MSSILLKIALFTLSLIVVVLFVFPRITVRGASASHVVISEVQLATATLSTDEFVELYNPTLTDVSLSDWHLIKRTAAGTPSILVATMSGTIKSHGYFLIGSSDYSGTVSADITYSNTANSLADNNTVVLGNNQNIIIDEVGFGSAIASETATTTNPAAGKSKERKASSSSTKDTMKIGGVDEFTGNGEDTDNNASDFVLRDIPQPQNSHSALEPVLLPTPTNTPSPTNTPTPTPTLTPTPTPSNTPTSTPTDTPVPTNTPSPTPTDTPTPTPTQTPTETPTETPTSTPTPTDTPIPTETPTPTDTPSPTPTESIMPASTFTPTPTVPQETLTPTPTKMPVFTPFHLSCTVEYKTFRIFLVTIRFPLISCKIIR